MYEKMLNLNEEAVSQLQSLNAAVTMTGQNRRVGANGVDHMSVYTYSKWHTWNRLQKTQFKQSFGPEVDTAVIGWFLQFPPITGFLDLMTAWVDTKTAAGTIVAYALDNNQTIILNNTPVTVNKGEGIKFSLRVPHEIRQSPAGQKWACLMQLV